MKRKLIIIGSAILLVTAVSVFAIRHGKAEARAASRPLVLTEDGKITLVRTDNLYVACIVYHTNALPQRKSP